MRGGAPPQSGSQGELFPVQAALSRQPGSSEHLELATRSCAVGLASTTHTWARRKHSVLSGATYRQQLSTAACQLRRPCKTHLHLRLVPLSSLLDSFLKCPGKPLCWPPHGDLTTQHSCIDQAPSLQLTLRASLPPHSQHAPPHRLPPGLHPPTITFHLTR